MSKTTKAVLITIGAILLTAIIFFSATPVGRFMWNAYDYSLQKTDEQEYEVKKSVEDTARAYIVQYNTDVMIYKTYADDPSDKAHDYAENARMRAIATANSYNEYIRKNSFVWKDNLPADLPEQLSIDIQ